MAMADRTYWVVGLGEILWDLLPAGRQLGGAPANFAYITSLLGDQGIPASRLGEDALGREAREQLARLHLCADSLQTDSAHATGTVKVELDARGQPCFEITEQVAWDFLEWTPAWQRLAEKADAVCFGSLAQRAPASRSTIQEFLRTTRADAVRVFDVNLRQHFFTREVLLESLQAATIVKLNHEELPRILQILELDPGDECSSARRLASRHKIQMVCVTRGPRGSLLVTRSGEVSEHPGFRVHVGDTVGAGDAFTAAMVHEYLRGVPIARMNEAANRMGAWVASQIGATPRPTEGSFHQALAAIR
jgi:fructokinase